MPIHETFTVGNFFKLKSLFFFDFRNQCGDIDFHAHAMRVRRTLVYHPDIWSPGQGNI